MSEKPGSKRGRPPKVDKEEKKDEKDAGPETGKLKWPKGMFSNSLPALMYACGDAQTPYQPTVDLVESIAVDYMEALLHHAMDVSVASRLSVDDLYLALRKDASKFGRAKELVSTFTMYAKQGATTRKDLVGEEKFEDFDEGVGGGGGAGE